MQSIELVTKMTPHFLSHIESSLAAGAADKAILQRRHELQGQLCAALQVRFPLFLLSPVTGMHCAAMRALRSRPRPCSGARSCTCPLMRLSLIHISEPTRPY